MELLRSSGFLVRVGEKTRQGATKATVSLCLIRAEWATLFDSNRMFFFVLCFSSSFLSLPLSLSLRLSLRFLFPPLSRSPLLLIFIALSIPGEEDKENKK